MRGFAVAIVGALAGVAQAEPTVSIEPVPHAAPWSDAHVAIEIRAGGGAPIVPLAVELDSPAGTVAAWGLEGQCRGADRACSIHGEWADSVRARRGVHGWEILVDTEPPSQMTRPPDALDRAATDQLVAATPVAPGQRIELETGVLASYEHAGPLTVTVRYAEVDPKAIALCAPHEPARSKAFVPCAPMTTLADAVYAPQAEWDRVARTITARAELVVEHPAFDLAAARARVKLATGRVGYARTSKQWILADDPGKRTIEVGATGTPRELPGDWIEQLIELEGGDEVSVYWHTSEPARVLAKLRGAGIAAEPFAHKGHADPDRLVVSLGRGEVEALASVVRSLGARMTPDGIVK